MKTAVSIPDDLFKKAEREAKRRGVSRSKLYQTALETLIVSKNDAAITAALNRSFAEHPDEDDVFINAAARAMMESVEWDDAAGRNLVDKPRAAKRIRTRVSKARNNRVGKRV